MTTSNNNQIGWNEAVKAIAAVIGLMSAVFALLGILLPTGLTQPIGSLIIGLIFTAILVWMGKLEMGRALITWLTISMVLIVLYLIVSRPATIVGSVVDSNSLPVKGLTLVLTDANGVDHKTVTDENGAFEIKNVSEGKFTVSTNGELLMSGQVPSGWKQIMGTQLEIGSIVYKSSSIVAATPTVVVTSDTPTPPPSVTTPSPIATIDTDPTIYDNFNNTAFDGSFNAGRWTLWETPTSQFERVAQQNGMLVVTRGAKLKSWAPIGARNDFTINKPTFFEAKLMMETSKPPESHTFIVLYPHSDLSSGDQTDCVMQGDGSSKQAEVLCSYSDKGEYISGVTKLVNYGEWHTVRIEVDPSKMMFTYYIDGKVINSYVPSNAEELKKVKFSFAIGLSGETAESFTGYIDDVRIGQ